jgi:UDP-N-acetylmuramate--alanine ligase
MNAEMKIKSDTNITLNQIRVIYFIGIGGIGMSAIARYFNSKGVQVSGYDRTRTDLTNKLEEEGIHIHFTEDISGIPKDADLVVYTPAVPKDHKELVYYQSNGYEVVKRSDVLQKISVASFNICVAGTHGKTTITTMIAHILRNSGYGCNAFLGGISVNYDTNFWSSKNNVCVIEADEYDRSFLKLSPDVAVISAMDADHLEIYGDQKHMVDAFIDFGNKIRENGLLISKHGLKRINEIEAETKLSYSLQNEAADAFAFNIEMDNGAYRFDVQVKGEIINGLSLNIGGMHNIENAVAAIAVAVSLKIDSEKIKEAISVFKGVKRRFEYIIPPVKKEKGEFTEPVLIDDYAHHPEELKALLKSVKSLFPQRTATIIFQPHLFSRTKDLANEFADALELADRVILLPIYPARELPMEGVSSKLIFDQVGKSDKYMLTKDEYLAWMKDHMKTLDKEFGEVFVMAGAGDIDNLVQPTKQIIENRP